jgi:hypothetical protein
MTKPLCKFLELTWESQADHLRTLPKRDLEVLWFQLQGHAESLDRLNLAVYSILRDLYEAQGQEMTAVKS